MEGELGPLAMEDIPFLPFQTVDFDSRWRRSTSSIGGCQDDALFSHQRRLSQWHFARKGQNESQSCQPVGNKKNKQSNINLLYYLHINI